MAAPPTCRACGAGLPRAALFCPKCGRPAFAFAGRRAQAVRNASVFGMAGSTLMVFQSGCMLAGGVVALSALGVAIRGDTRAAIETAGTAVIFVGLTLLFDLIGVAFLALALYVHAKTARSAARLAPAPDPARHSLARQGFLASACLALWLVVTVAWRGALAAFVSFYPTPLGVDLQSIASADVRRGAGIMLGLWVVAAFLFLFGAILSTRFLQRARGAPVTLPRLLWPTETVVHAGTATTIAIVAPGILAQSLASVQIGTVQAVEVLGGLELIVVPALGLLAYVSLFREFLGLFRESPPARASRTSPAPSEPPGGGEA